VDIFRACTNLALQDNEAAVETHQQAARHAVSRWNLFVQHSLNAPTDFPFEPQSGPVDPMVPLTNIHQRSN
jgi:hypothetical protein